jgi:hypothetical protein
LIGQREVVDRTTASLAGAVGRMVAAASSIDAAAALMVLIVA